MSLTMKNVEQKSRNQKDFQPRKAQSSKAATKKILTTKGTEQQSRNPKT
jgi:hypothetical protein